MRYFRTSSSLFRRRLTGIPEMALNAQHIKVHNEKKNQSPGKQQPTQKSKQTKSDLFVIKDSTYHEDMFIHNKK